MKFKVFIFTTLSIVLVGGFILMSSCGNSGKKENRVSISGAFALYPMTVKWSEMYRESHPDVKISISAGGAGKGLVDAMTGMIDLGMFSRHLTQAEIDQGVWWIAVAKDAVVPTINDANPAYQNIVQKGVTKEMFQRIFLNTDPLYFSDLTGNESDNAKVNVYTRSDACGAGEMWANFLGVNQEDLEGIGVFGDPGIADAVKKDVQGIGYNNIIYAYDIQTGLPYAGIKVIPVDMNANGQIDPEEEVYGTLREIGKAIGEGRYPAPPARELYLVAKEKPTNPAVVAFLEWILTDGQQYVEEAGYVQLDKETINAQKEKLK